jgi:hypothetical protein
LQETLSWRPTIRDHQDAYIVSERHAVRQLENRSDVVPIRTLLAVSKPVDEGF